MPVAPQLDTLTVSANSGTTVQLITCYTRTSLKPLRCSLRRCVYSYLVTVVDIGIILEVNMMSQVAGIPPDIPVVEQNKIGRDGKPSRTCLVREWLDRVVLSSGLRGPLIASAASRTAVCLVIFAFKVYSVCIKGVHDWRQ